jgi:hypothetical protein
MTVSLKKIVESRSRRGGVNLHRNLLIAGVLFKARDVMLAEQTKCAAPVTCLRPTTETAAEQEPTSTDSCQPMEDDSAAPVVPEIVAEEPSLPTTVVESSVSMDWSSVETPSSSDSKENIPPPNSLPVPAVFPPSSADVAVRGVKRQTGVADEDDATCPPSKSPRLEDASDHCVPDVQCAASPSSVDCKSRPNKSNEIRKARTACSSRSSKKMDQKSGGTVAYQPIVCLPHVDVKSTSVWNSFVRPIFVVQVV